MVRGFCLFVLQTSMTKSLVVIAREFAGDTPATTVKRFGAVSSVVERLVYTERVGGSKPSPPISALPIPICDTEMLRVLATISD